MKTVRRTERPEGHAEKISRRSVVCGGLKECGMYVWMDGCTNVENAEGYKKCDREA